MIDVKEHLAWSETPGGLRIELMGEIDYTVSARIREAVRGLLGGSDGVVHMELGGVKYLDSSGLAVLIEAKRRLVESGRELRVGSVSPQVSKLFQLTRVGGLFGLD